MSKKDSGMESTYSSDSLTSDDDDDSCKILEKEISDMEDEIASLKQQMYELYQIDKTQIMFKDIKRKSDEDENDSVLPRKKTMPNCSLETLFYESFLKVSCNNNAKKLSVVFPLDKQISFGLSFVSNNPGKFVLDKAYLPLSFSFTEIKEQTGDVNLENLHIFVSAMHKHIFTDHIRTKQVEELEAIKDTYLELNCSLNCDYISLTFYISSEKFERSEITIELIYPPLFIRPKSVSLDCDNEEINKYKDEILDVFNVFHTYTLADAYKLVFEDENSHGFNFFIDELCDM